VEGIHFDLSFVSPSEAFEKALLANLSDINAMGGFTDKVFLNLCALKSWGLVDAKELGKTIRRLEDDYGFRICGGDTVRKENDCFFSFTVLGEVKGQPLLRSRACPGDKIYVSGCLGASAAGLFLFQQGMRLGQVDKKWEPLLKAHTHPQPPLALGPALSAFKRVAAIDISDGLSSELWHLSKQSNCRLLIYADKLPAHSALSLAGDAKQCQDWVLHGGEEYQLLFTGTFSPEEISQLHAFALITEIGAVQEGSGVYICEPFVEEALLNAKGWVH
jgi:thiamine-monophosphate kinase